MGIGHAHRPKPAEHHAKPASHDAAVPMRKPSLVGDQYLDNGLVCDQPLSQRPPMAICDLVSATRARVLTEVVRRTGVAKTNYQFALEEKRVDLLLSKSDDWGLLGDLAFGAVAALLIACSDGLLAPAVEAAEGAAIGAEAAASAETANAGRGILGPLIKSGVTAIRAPLKDKLRTLRRDVAAKQYFVHGLLDAAGQLFIGITSAVEAKGDDAALLAWHAALADSNVSVSVFAAQVDELVARFSANRLDQLGRDTLPTSDDHPRELSREVVRIRNGKHIRYAVIQFADRLPPGLTIGDVLAMSKPVPPGPPLAFFLNWLDADFVDDGQSIQMATFGTMRTLDVDHPVIRDLSEIAAFAEEQQ